MATIRIHVVGGDGIEIGIVQEKFNLYFVKLILIYI